MLTFGFISSITLVTLEESKGGAAGGKTLFFHCSVSCSLLQVYPAESRKCVWVQFTQKQEQERRVCQRAMSLKEVS
jgi:hypothetical protein